MIRVYSVCHSVCIFWMHHSKVKPPYSKFRVITGKFSGVPILRNFTVLRDRGQRMGLWRGNVFHLVSAEQAVGTLAGL